MTQPRAKTTRQAKEMAKAAAATAPTTVKDVLGNFLFEGQEYIVMSVDDDGTVHARQLPPELWTFKGDTIVTPVQ